MGRGRRRDEGPGILDDLMVLSRAYPSAGIVIASALTLLGGYLWFIKPRAIYGTGQIWGFIVWLIAAASLFAALIGFIDRRVRSRCLDAQRTPEDLKAMSWRQFEQLVADLFRRQGFRVRETGGQGDGGVDLILIKDGGRHLVQCKQYRTWSVGVQNVREFYGAMAAHTTRCEGIFVTCGRFTHDAIDFAAGKPLRLIDGDALLKMIVHSNAVAPAVEAFTTPASPSAAPAPQSNAAPLCHKCNIPMVRRVAKTGGHAGRPFWGCVNYPRCKQIVNIG